ncbi:SigB/SigF/SigG family RNA polymerase sigma factor [Streptomyces sp. G1]|uniref:SigB/SigF/SigG family RNA polymerase sigma factor n=1 Tax=Streptomyces sp. G1 TaxID=361572 RepID=UPI002030FB7D|nr:SigB/SigF/SigG family RNA polymerase sigma factor [Streptomyces sp. G1]MCM1966545.1 SigB/SigF/SigG family RNA polymerase sigma factor [Streptomyces sp. G1]
MSPVSSDTTDPLRTGLRTDLRTETPDVPDDPFTVSTGEARTLSVALFRRLKELDEGTPEYSYVRNTLVELNLSLVKYAARRFRNRSEPMEDIVQVGTVGLIKAINRYDVERGVEFTTFAIPTITGEMKRFFRDTSWSVKVPRRLQELRLDIAKTQDALEQQLGRQPTDPELAQRLGITTEALDEGRRAANGYVAGSLDAPVGPEADGGPRGWPLGEEEAAYDRIECLETLKPLIATLSDRDRLILSLRFGQELNQSEIGDRLGLSQMHVSRLLSRIMARLRTGMLEDAEADAEAETGADAEGDRPGLEGGGAAG